MATRFRALAAPIDVSTGDQRRLSPEGGEVAPLPHPLRWVRDDTGEHDNAMIVGRVDSVELADEGQWVEGTFFDDIDREAMPRLAEDVAEAMHLAREGTLGISVDLDNFDAHPVRVGTDDPVNIDEITEDDQVELLATKWRIRAETLVAIPAFAETNHTIQFLDDAEPVEGEPAPGASTDEEDYDALVASLGVVDVDRFLPPVEITEPTPITYDYDNGIAYGHIYQNNTCHVGILDRCAQPPAGDDFRLFHIHPVETSGGTVYAGRLTVGGLHADRSANLSQVQREHDKKTVAAYVRAWVDEFGIMVCGPIQSDLDDSTREVLARRKVSGHWPEVGETLALAELLALPPGDSVYSEPGFPVGVHVRNGRIVGMTAALGPSGLPEPEPAEPRVYRPSARKIADQIDLSKLAHEIVSATRADEEERRQAAELRAKLSADLTEELRAKLEVVLDVHVQ